MDLQKYVDEVFNVGLANKVLLEGDGRTREDPSKQYGTADLFLHITSNYKFVGFDILPDYGVFDIFKNPDIPRALEDYNRHLGKHCL